MVHNPDWLMVLSPPRAGPSGSSRGGSTTGGTRSGSSFCVPCPTRVSINGGPPSRESPAKHVLIPLKEIPGYRGAKQQRCFECNALCSWACARCSTGKEWVALHPTICQGSKRKYECLAMHRKNPMGGGYKEHHQSISGTSTMSKRRRAINLVHIE